MKKLCVFLTAVLLSGCAGTSELSKTANDIGMSLFKSAVNQKCQSEVKAHQYYQMASLIMSEAQKASVTEKVCGCVSDKAPESVTMAEIATAAIDGNQRPVIVAKAVKHTLQACVVEWIS